MTTKATTAAAESKASATTKAKETSKAVTTTEETGKAKETSVASGEDVGETECEHNWVAVTKAVHHEAATENVLVVDETEWYEEVYVGTVDEPIYDSHQHWFCGECGFDFTAAGYTSRQLADHMLEHGRNGGSTSSYTDKAIIGYEHYDEYETVYHEAQTHWETQAVAAYDETVIAGYKCSKCGATK